MVEKTEEQPSDAEQCLRHYGRSSRTYFLISLASIVLAFLDYGIEVGFDVKGWGVLLFSVIRVVICGTGTACFIAAGRAGKKARRGGNLWAGLALLVFPINGVLWTIAIRMFNRPMSSFDFRKPW